MIEAEQPVFRSAILSAAEVFIIDVVIQASQFRRALQKAPFECPK